MMMDKLIKKFGESKLLATGILKRQTLEKYKSHRRKACNVTIIAVAQALGEDWHDYVN